MHMNKIFWILLGLVIVVAPSAYFLGFKAYFTILGIIALLGAFSFGLYYAYWYIFVRQTE